MDGIPKDVTYFYRDHNSESTRGTRFQVKTANNRVLIVDVASSKAPKTLGK